MIAKLSVNFLFFSLSPSLKMRYIFPLSAQEGGSRIVIAKEGLCFVLILSFKSQESCLGRRRGETFYH
jgi:hypothetical protein